MKDFKDNVLFAVRNTDLQDTSVDSEIHVYGNSHVCLTDNIGYATPKNKDITELILHAPEGFIPLWARNVTLRWRFSPTFSDYFQNPVAAQQEIRRLFGSAVLAWRDAAPVSFTEKDDAWDFEIVMRPDICNSKGCVMASAFFPDSGRHQLAIYPKFYLQSGQEQIETFIHELGHIFGLRHFFAKIHENHVPSVVYGTENPRSIMNYGPESVLTELDISDLKMLYQKVWNGELRELNNTRIVTFYPYHVVGGI